MRVECVSKQVDSVASRSPIGEELRRSIGPNVSSLDLSLDALYTVYAIEIRNGHPWYFVADDLYESLCYPLAYASVFFRTADSRVSSCWNFGFRTRGDEQAPNVLIAFKEWLENETFFERLIDGNDREFELFQRYKVFMDLEFPSPLIKEKAEELEGIWIMCPQCNEAWESDSTCGLVRCPKCGAVLINPRYLPPAQVSN